MHDRRSAGFYQNVTHCPTASCFGLLHEKQTMIQAVATPTKINAADMLFK